MHRCFDEEQAVRLAAGLLAPHEARRLVHEVESCRGCRALLVEAGIALKADAPPPEVDLQVGDTLLGRYEIQRSLGRGGMGEVFAAFDRQLCQALALKTIRPELSADPKIVARFRQELHLACQVTHPNVVRVFDVGSFTTRTGQSAHYFTMELLEGQPMSRWRKQRSLALPAALSVLQQVASGLAAIHALGIVHRDLKPENVLLCNAEPLAANAGQGLRAVVLDFGVAHSSDRVNGLDTTSAGVRLGTPDYMAPEVLCGKPATPASDVYSFGLVAYELLCGRHPCPDRGMRATLSALGELKISPLAKYNPELPEALSAFVLQCLHNESAHRPANASQVVQGLQAFGEATR